MLILVDSVFQAFACFENRVFACCDRDLFARLRVAAFSGFSSFYFERTETDDLYFIFEYESFFNAREQCVYCFFCIFFRQFCFFCNTGDQFCFIQPSGPPYIYSL